MLTTERKHKVLVVSCSQGHDPFCCGFDYFNFLRESPREEYIRFAISVSSIEERDEIYRFFSEYEPEVKIGIPGRASPICIGRRNDYFPGPYITETFNQDICFCITCDKYEAVKEKILSLPGYKIFDFPLSNEVYGIYLLR